MTTSNSPSLPPLTCDVCRSLEPPVATPAIGVASSGLGPISFAYCEECASLGREPYYMVVGVVAMNVDTRGDWSALAEWAVETVKATFKYASKTEAQFWDDVDKLRANMAADMQVPAPDDTTGNRAPLPRDGDEREG